MSRTASGAAFCRLVEQGQDPRVRQFDDPVVRLLLDPTIVTMATAGPWQKQLLESLAPGTYGGQVMRTRYIDDVVRAWSQAGITQVVILGAGLDTRAYRLPELAHATVFEVDLPAIQQGKRHRLRDVRPLAQDVRFVPIDLSIARLDVALAEAGFDPDAPALYIWEGVTQYLTEAAVRTTLRSIATAAYGSGLVLTYIVRRYLPEHGGDAWSEGLAAQIGPAEPWIFGLDPVDLPGFLGDAGMQLVSDVGADDYQTRYLDPIGRDLLISPGERVALAVV